MKKTLVPEEKSPLIVRLVEFAEGKGGFGEMARKTDKHPTTFYNMVSRNAKPSVDTLYEIAEAYEDFDLNYIITGRPRRGQGVAGEQELQRVREELDRERAIVSRLVGKPKGGAIRPGKITLTAVNKNSFVAGCGRRSWNVYRS